MIAHKNTNIYVENHFFLKGKTLRQTSNQFTIIKSITIIFVYVSRLKKNFTCFSLLSHTLIISIKGGNILLSPFYFSSPRTTLSLGCLLSLSGSLLAALSFLLCSFLFLCLFYMWHSLVTALTNSYTAH